MSPVPANGSDSAEMWRAIRARFPGLREALVADARATARYRGERDEFHGRVTRNMVTSLYIARRRL